MKEGEGEGVGMAAAQGVNLDDIEELEVRFRYHPPTGEQRHDYRTLRSSGRLLAQEVYTRVPESRERDIALAKIEEAIMWANAGIARRTTFDG